MSHIALRIVEITLGVLLIYLRFCLYETEEGKLQNALVDLWVYVSEVADSTRARFDALLRMTARLSADCLDRVLGPRLLSLQSVVVSTGLAGSSILIGGAAINWGDDSTRDLLLGGAALLLLACLAPGATSWFATLLKVLKSA